MDLPTRRRYAVHGLAVDLDCRLQGLDAEVRRLLGEFEASALAETAGALGTVRAFDAAEVQRRLSSAAMRIEIPGQLYELYQDAERFWLLDDRWGMTEIDLLRNTWRSWMLPRPTVDPAIVAEMAVMWPMAQLLRGRGLFLLPAVSVAREGWGLLLIAPFSLVLEVDRLARSGFQIIGQRWTALRQGPQGMEMLRMPGRMEQPIPPQFRPAYQDAWSTASLWVDLGKQYCGVERSSAGCDLVLTVQTPRRAVAGAAEFEGPEALAALRRHWPIVELHSQRQRGQLPVKLARACRCCEITLSRRTDDLLAVLETLRWPKAQAKKVA